MELSGKRILVIGGAGFIGSHVVEQLLKYNVASVTVFDNFTRGSLDNLGAALTDARCSIFRDGGDVREVDVLDAAVSNADAVVHLAAMWLLHCVEYPRTAFDVNVQGTFNILEACIRHSIERVVFSSSASVYGDPISEPITEGHPQLNRNFYGATKMAGEAMLTALSSQYNLNAVGLRYMNVYGPRQKKDGAYSGVIPSAIESIMSGKAPVVNGDGTQAYDFVSVEDAARANVCALQTDAQGFFNVGTGVATTVREVVEALAGYLDYAGPIDFTRYESNDPRGRIMRRVGSTALARQQIGFQAQDELMVGLKSMVVAAQNERLESVQRPYSPSQSRTFDANFGGQ